MKLIENHVGKKGSKMTLAVMGFSFVVLLLCVFHALSLSLVTTYHWSNAQDRSYFYFCTNMCLTLGSASYSFFALVAEKILHEAAQAIYSYELKSTINTTITTRNGMLFGVLTSFARPKSGHIPHL